MASGIDMLEQKGCIASKYWGRIERLGDDDGDTWEVTWNILMKEEAPLQGDGGILNATRLKHSKYQ